MRKGRRGHGLEKKSTPSPSEKTESATRNKPKGRGVETSQKTQVQVPRRKKRGRVKRSRQGRVGRPLKGRNGRKGASLPNKRKARRRRTQGHRKKTPRGRGVGEVGGNWSRPTPSPT